MVADDQRDLAVELARAMSQQQVVEAVVVLRDEQRQALVLRAIGDAPVELEALRGFGDGPLQADPVGVELAQVDADPLEELPLGLVGVLVRVEDVGPVAVEQLGQPRHDAAAIGAADEQRGRVLGSPSGHGAAV